MRHRRVLLATPLGLCLGFVGHALYDRTVFDRPERLVRLFSELCLAETPANPEELGLTRIKPEGGTQRWVDTKSRSFLHVLDTRCSVQAHEPRKLSSSSVTSVANQVGVLVERDFPTLTFDENISTTEPSPQDFWMAGWMTGAPASEDRWGIYVFNARTRSDEGSLIILYKGLQIHPFSAEYLAQQAYTVVLAKLHKN